MWSEWVIDATFANPPGVYAFCPIEADGAVVLGMTMMTDKPPGKLVGVMHSDGEAAAQAWLDAHKDEYDALKAA